MNRIWKSIRQYLEGVKRGDRKLSRDGMLIVFLGGILLYVICLPVNNNNSYFNKKQTQNTAEQTENTSNSEMDEIQYRRKLEEELETFLAKVEGVGQVEVLIYMETSPEYIVEKDTPVYETSRDGESESSSETRKEETTVYTTSNYGEQVPFVSQTRKPQIEGMVIAAEGAANESVRIQLVRSAMALYGIEANKVEVLTLQQTQKRTDNQVLLERNTE